MKMWNNCIKIHNGNDFIVDVDRDMFSSYQLYCTIIRHEPKMHVWYDTVTKKCFGPEQDFYANPGDFSFFSQKESFSTKPHWGAEHLQRYLPPIFGEDASNTTQYVIQDFDELKKYEDKTILMIGGGPSAKDVDWKNMDIEYDYVWSCNNFYLNSEMNEFGVSLAFLGPPVDLESKELQAYVNENKTTCVFEAGISPFRRPEEFELFKEACPDRSCYIHQRYFSKLGTVARMVCLGTFLRAKKIYFVGMDGFPGKDGNKYEHVFEGPKKDHGGRLFSYDLHRRQYVLLWDYLLNTLEDYGTEYQNLGEGHPANQSSDISKKEFPLPNSFK